MKALAGPRAENRYLAHVGGAGRLMELQGPAKCKEDFARELLRFNRGGIVSMPCFPTLVYRSPLEVYQLNSNLRSLQEGRAITVIMQRGISCNLAQWLIFLR